MEKKEMKHKKTFINEKGFGLNEILGIAAAIIIAAFIIIPQLREFAESVTDSLDDWWTTMSASIFETG